MKRLGRLTFTRLSAASFVLCIAIAVLCLQSFQGGWRLHFRTSDARCMLKSSDGMLVIEGPPSGQRDDVTRGIASRMSNKDFQWGPTTPQAGGLYLKGEVRRGSPTWDMFQLYRNRLAASKDLEAGERLWLKALDEPDKLAPAHMLLALATGHWRDARLWEEQFPLVFMPSESDGSSPRLADWRTFRNNWDDLVDVPIFSVPHVVLFAIASILPLAWITNEKNEHRRTARWAFHFCGVLSLFACGAAMTFWFRSYRTGDRWYFRSKDAPAMRYATAGMRHLCAEANLF